jgi:hypothetical protein
MPVVGMGLAWAGYTLMFWGWTLVKGYGIGIADIVVPGRYTGSWPPPAAGAVNASSSVGAPSSNSSTSQSGGPDVNGTSGNTDGPVQPEGPGTE